MKTSNLLRTSVAQPIRDTFEAPSLEGGVMGSAWGGRRSHCKTMLGQIAGELYVWRLQRSFPPFLCHLHWTKGVIWAKWAFNFSVWAYTFFLLPSFLPSFLPSSLPSSLLPSFPPSLSSSWIWRMDVIVVRSFRNYLTTYHIIQP